MAQVGNKSRVLLGVNVDHVATLREARGARYPEPVAAALAAGVGHAERLAEIGPRHPQAVIRAVVDHHVRLLRHVALDARSAVARLTVNDRLVKVMRSAVVRPGLVTVRAQRVSFPE